MLPLNPSEIASLRSSDSAAAARPAKSDLLTAEYMYAMNTAIQANEDRNKAVNFFILITSITVAAITQFKSAAVPTVAYIGVLAGLGLIGWTHFFNIVRLRQAFHESVKCMSKLKEYWLDNYPDDAKFRSAFLWKSTTIPAPDRAWTLSFFAALTITLISSASLGGAVAFAIREVLVPLQASASAATAAAGNSALSPNAMFFIGLAAAVALTLFQIGVYFMMLREPRTSPSAE